MGTWTLLPPTSNEAVPSHPLPLLEPYQKKPAKADGLNKIQSLIAKYQNIQVSKQKITHHTQDAEDSKLNEKRQSSEVYAPNNRPTKYMKQKVIELKTDVDKSSVTVGAFNTILSTLIELDGKLVKIYKVLHNTIIQQDLINIH